MSGSARTMCSAKLSTTRAACVSAVAVITVTIASGPSARAQRPPQAAPVPYVSSVSPAALAAFSPQLKSFGGRWSDGKCELRWNDWSISGLEITFHDQSGGLDVERVVDLQPGAFVTQSVATSHGAAPSFWKYQPISLDVLRVQNVSRGMSFSLRRCPPPAGTLTAASPSAGGAAVAAPNLGAPTAPTPAPVAPTQPIRGNTANPSAGPDTAQNAIGPSFDCQKARDPVAATICSDPALKLVDLEFNQAYQALRFQLPEEQRPALRQESVAFLQTVTQACHLPGKGVPDAAAMARATPCLAQAYRSKRADWLGRLSAEAAQEAWRSIPRHVALQNRLAETGMTQAGGPADGVYGVATRDAIVRFQTQHGLAPSGFMTDATADALTRFASHDPDATNPDVENSKKQLDARVRNWHETLAEVDLASRSADSAHKEDRSQRKAGSDDERTEIEERRKAIAAALTDARSSPRVADPDAEKDRLQREAEQRVQKPAADQNVRKEAELATEQQAKQPVDANRTKAEVAQAQEQAQREAKATVTASNLQKSDLDFDNEASYFTEYLLSPITKRALVTNSGKTISIHKMYFFSIDTSQFESGGPLVIFNDYSLGRDSKISCFLLGKDAEAFASNNSKRLVNVFGTIESFSSMGGLVIKPCHYTEISRGN